MYGLQHIYGPLNFPHALLPSILGYFKFRTRRLSPLLFEFEYLCRHWTLFVLNGVDGGPQLAHLRRPCLLSRLVLGDGVIVEGRVIFGREIVWDGGGKRGVRKTDVIVSR